MRCSLLILSTSLDGELTQSRAAELEAHLVGCTRCHAGLGYLHEESERISGLARVYIPDYSVHALMAQVGIIDEDTRLPGTMPPTPPRVHPSATEPWFGHDAGKALPWAPPPRRPEAPIPEPRAPIETSPSEPVDDTHVEIAGTAVEPAQRVIEDQPIPAPDEAQTPEDEDSFDIDISQPPPIPQQLPQEAGPRFIKRIRDAIAVRWALTRGVQTDDDDSVEIVSGSGAGEWTESARQRVQRERAAQRAMSATSHIDEATVAAVSWAPPAPAPSAQPETPRPEMPTQPRPLLDWEDQPPAPAPAPVPRPSPPRTETPGRHTRIVSTGSNFSVRSWLKPRVRAPSRPHLPLGQAAATSPLADPRIWVFAGGAFLLLVIGVLTGKHTTAIPSLAQNPVASAHPSARAVPSSAPVLPPPPVATPVPTASPLQLTGTQTLGSGARGFAVTGMRYAQHAGGDFRMVFDMAPVSGATGTGLPNMVAGFGNPTTLYVIFVGVTPGADTGHLPPSVNVTNVQVLQPSPIAGHVVYEFSLSHPAKLSSSYYAGPRLVLDLTG